MLRVNKNNDKKCTWMRITVHCLRLFWSTVINSDSHHLRSPVIFVDSVHLYYVVDAVLHFTCHFVDRLISPHQVGVPCSFQIGYKDNSSCCFFDASFLNSWRILNTWRSISFFFESQHLPTSTKTS